MQGKLSSYILVVIACAVSAYGGARYATKSLRNLTPVVVMNVDHIVKDANPSDPDAVSKVRAQVTQYREYAQNLGKRGVVVLDSRYLLAAPESSYVHPDH